MTDPTEPPRRQAPRWGEYSDDPPAVTPPPPVGLPVAAPPPAGYSAPPPAVSRGRRVDGVVSGVLLGYGLLNVLGVIATGSTLGNSIAQAASDLGISGFTDAARVNSLSVVISASYAAIWLVTLLLTVRQVRRKRIAFYIPILGAVAASAFVALVVSVAGA